jgi:hypothetical protein
MNIFSFLVTFVLLTLLLLLLLFCCQFENNLLPICKEHLENGDGIGSDVEIEVYLFLTAIFYLYLSICAFLYVHV